jgi:hypothetical protein
MKKLIVVLVVGMMATSASAAQLSMRWAGNAPGDFEKTLNPGETASIEIVWTMNASDTAKSLGLDNLDGRFFVWGSEPVAAPIGSTDVLSYTSVTGFTAVAPGFVSGASVGIGSPLESAFFAFTNGTLIKGNGVSSFDTVIGTVDFQCQGEAPQPVLISYNVIPPSPGAYGGTTGWVHRWQYPTPTYPLMAGQYRIGEDAAGAAAGNPGDAASNWDPYHGLETFTPLILHQIPEPASLALLALGSLALIRRR